MYPTSQSHVLGMLSNTKATTAQLAMAFTAGLVFGSIMTRILFPGVSWQSCRELGINTAARCPQPETHHATTTTRPPAADILGLNNAAPLHLVRVNGTYNAPSPFKGPPSPDVDRAWAAYWKVWLVSVDHDAFSAALPEHPASAVRLGGGTGADGGGRYLATLAASHQLHCLYNLLRASYRDVYADEQAEYERDPGKWHERVDHCVDILRQRLEW